MRQNLNELPPDLPVPADDGKANHLLGMVLPSIKLRSTHGNEVHLSQDLYEKAVLFIYPRAGGPLESNNNPVLWDSIPGARGCTPQSCGFRDLHQEFNRIGYKIYGMSIQKNKVQTEFAERNHIPFPILSDFEYKFTDQMNLPTFLFEGERLIKRMALVIESGQIQKVFYPVFPPDQNAMGVIEWLKTHRRL